MNIKDYEFNVGDEVITTEGVKGKIVKICTCHMCEERGFYEPIWVAEDSSDERYITIDIARFGFYGFYKIGKYRFHDFDKAELLSYMASCEKELKQLKKQLQFIEEYEVGL